MSNDFEENPGGQGERASFTRSDFVLMRKAARERWGVPDVLKTETLFQAAKILATAESDRDRLAAAKVIAALDKIDQADERLAFDREKFERDSQEGEVETVRDAVADMLASSERYDQEHGTPGGTEEVSDGPGEVQRDDPGEG